MAKFKFYNIHKLVDMYPEAHYYVVFGERSNGKTYSALEYALQQYAENGEEFAYIRRWAEDIRPKNLGTLFRGHIENHILEKYFGDKYDSMKYQSQKFYLGKTNEEDGSVDWNEQSIGYAFDINSMEHYKSTSYPKVTTVIFDEFLSRNGYLPNEFILFTNTLSTIIRHRDNVKIFMLGNTVNKYCPYFAEMGLTGVKDMKSGQTDVYRYGDTGLYVVVEYAESTKKSGGKASDVYFAFDNPELKMITTGAWEIAIYPHLERGPKRKDVALDVFFDFDDELLHGEIAATDEGYYIFIHKKTTPIKDDSEDIVYTNKANPKWNYRMAITKQSDKLSKYILQLIREGNAFYDTNETGEIIRNYLNWSDSYSIKN